MLTYLRAARRTPTTALLPTALLWCCSLWWWTLAAPVHAACIQSPDQDIRRLESEVDQDPGKALKEIQLRLDQVGANVSLRAALYAVQAEAFGVLELSDDARAAASEGLRLATDVHDPVRLQLLSAYAENTYEGARLPAAIADLEQGRAAQVPGGVTDTCLLIVRGLLEYRQDRSDLAIATLSHAYKVATVLPTQVHVAAASTLSLLMRSMGDYPEALTLNQEEIDWATTRGATMSLSVARFMRGQILKLQGKYDAAIAEYSQARKLSVQLNDSQGIAYADLRICDSRIELDALAPARLECDNAARLFSASQSADMVKETRALLARIDLKEGHPEKALAALNSVLDQQGADLAPLHVADLYELRAQANAALHKYRDAYDDLRVYVERYTATNDAERHRQAAALRARFETDREVARNETLKHELSDAEERSKRQARELKLNTLAGAASACVIALLIYFLLTNLRYRKQLTTLAREDALTGLPNRRRIAELATDAVQNASATGAPLSIALIDMDHFKIINDRCGHATGDFVLKEIARAGAETLRATDTLGRWGGEEFLLLMPGATLEVAAANLERLRTWVSAIRLPISGVGLRVSLSAGLVAFDANAKSLDDLVARADAALYAAKNEGRDRVKIADLTRITGSHAARRVSRS